MFARATSSPTPRSNQPLTGAAANALALLADHLEAVLRHGEDLRALERPAGMPAFSGASVPAMMRRSRHAGSVASEAHALELAIILRLTQIRTSSAEVKRLLPQTTALLTLVGAAAGLVTDQPVARETGPADDFFVSRGLPREASAAAPAFGETYLIAGATPLGAVMDAVAAALDMLDVLAATKADTASAAMPTASATDASSDPARPGNVIADQSGAA